MARPSFFLVCRVKQEGWKRSLVVPIPLALVDDMVGVGLSVYSVVKRFYRPRLSQWDMLPVDASQLTPALKELPRLWHQLRRSGPFTLVSVRDEGVSVDVRFL